VLTSLTGQNLSVHSDSSSSLSDISLQHASHQDVDFGPNLFNNVTISKAEHEYLVSTVSFTAASAIMSIYTRLSVVV
jgi:hypothetical protein